MNKSIIFVTIAVLIVGMLFGVLSFVKYDPTTPYITEKDTAKANDKATTNLTIISNTENQNNQITQNVSPVISAPSGKISLSQLGEHRTKTDCWVGYNGKAYDVTTFLPKHPGGVGAISSYCGTSTEFQQAFQRQHGTSKASSFMKVSIYKGDLE